MSSRSPKWRKSSRSSGNTDNCVEVALPTVGATIRDSKNPAAGHLDLDQVAWASFLVTVKTGRLDH
jgi:hypothetical protein